MTECDANLSKPTANLSIVTDLLHIKNFTSIKLILKKGNGFIAD